MQRTLPLEAKGQPSGLRHLRRIVFDGFARPNGMADAFYSDLTLKHPLNSVHTVQNEGITQVNRYASSWGEGFLLFLLARCRTVRDRLRPGTKGRADAIGSCLPVGPCRAMFIFTEEFQPLH